MDPVMPPALHGVGWLLSFPEGWALLLVRLFAACLLEISMSLSVTSMALEYLQGWGLHH